MMKVKQEKPEWLLQTLASQAALSKDKENIFQQRRGLAPCQTMKPRALLGQEETRELGCPGERKPEQPPPGNAASSRTSEGVRA